MSDLNGFDANTVDPSVGFEPIPAGKYTAVITESEMKPTKSNTGEYLELKFQIIEGEFANRLLFARLNMRNANEMAVKIALAELSAICHAVGVMKPKDSLELHNLPLTIKVVRKKRQDNGEYANEINGYEGKNASPMPAAAAVAPYAKQSWQQQSA